jgi:hypothetical protein
MSGGASAYPSLNNLSDGSLLYNGTKMIGTGKRRVAKKKVINF